MTTQKNGLKANAPQSLLDIDKYLYGFDNNGPETAGVYQCELNLLINHYKELVKQFRQDNEKRELVLAKERLTYWTELQRNSEQEDWYQVLLRGWAQQGKRRRKKTA